MTWQKLNPLRMLRVRVGLLVLGVIAALTVFTTQYFSERLTNSYREAGRAQLGAIASLWDDSFRIKQLANPQGIQRRINALRQKNDTLHKLSVSWHDPDASPSQTAVRSSRANAAPASDPEAIAAPPASRSP